MMNNERSIDLEEKQKKREEKKKRTRAKVKSEMMRQNGRGGSMDEG